MSTIFDDLIAILPNGSVQEIRIGAFWTAVVVETEHQQRCGLAYPIRQGRAIELDTGPGIDAALPVQRSMIAVFADQHMRQECRAGAATLDRQA